MITFSINLKLKSNIVKRRVNQNPEVKKRAPHWGEDLTDSNFTII